MCPRLRNWERKREKRERRKLKAKAKRHLSVSKGQAGELVPLPS